MCLLKPFSTKAKIGIQYPSPLTLWTKEWNSCLLKPPSPGNTERLSHKSGNKNNVKGKFIGLIFSKIYSKLLLSLYWQTWHFLKYISSGKAIRLPYWSSVAQMSPFFHIFQVSNVKFKLLLTNCFSSFTFLLAQNDYLTSTAIV